MQMYSRNQTFLFGPSWDDSLHITFILDKLRFTLGRLSYATLMEDSTIYSDTDMGHELYCVCTYLGLLLYSIVVIYYVIMTNIIIYNTMYLSVIISYLHIITECTN